MSLATASPLTTSLRDLTLAQEQLGQISPLLWRGLPGGGVLEELTSKVPAFVTPCLVATRTGMPVVRNGYLVPTGRTVGEQTEYEAQAFILPYPGIVPTATTASGESVPLTNCPRILAKPGHYLYLRATWSIRPNYQLTCDDASLVNAASLDLEDGNDYTGLETPANVSTRRSWHHLLGQVTATGLSAFGTILIPFTPPILQT